MFWNLLDRLENLYKIKINRKHEMFWNDVFNNSWILSAKLTVNMKCFEMEIMLWLDFNIILINRKHEMFWNSKVNILSIFTYLLTVNMKCFEIL